MWHIFVSYIHMPAWMKLNTRAKCSWSIGAICKNPRDRLTLIRECEKDNHLDLTQELWMDLIWYNQIAEKTPGNFTPIWCCRIIASLSKRLAAEASDRLGPPRSSGWIHALRGLSATNEHQAVCRVKTNTCKAEPPRSHHEVRTNRAKATNSDACHWPNTACMQVGLVFK